MGLAPRAGQDPFDRVGEPEVALGDTARRVRPERQRHHVPVDRNVRVVVLLVGRVSDARNQFEGRSEVARCYGPRQSTIGELPGGQRGEPAGDLSVGEHRSGGHGPILADRGRGSSGDQPRWGAYDQFFELLDYRSIASSNWDSFAPYFAFGSAKGKDNQLAWFSMLSAIRNRIAHPERGTVSEEELGFIEALADHFEKVAAPLL